MFLRRVGRLAILATVAVVGLLVTNLSVPQSVALSGNEFDAGNIISDANFYNGSAMTETEIQQFLTDAVGGRCDNANCLANYRADTPTRTWSWGTCSTYAGGARESAARIIFKVQQACNLSAKVILVTLQKEQSLVTDRAPSDGVMRKAMGYGCPDTDVCDSTYYGFFNQIFAAGRQLTWYSNPGGSFTSIKIGTYNPIRYSPNSACGVKSVLVKNRATAALYYYTPYTPNAAALANLGGLGDGCSAYGNRNFWVFYNSWFGSPTTAGANEIDRLWTSLGGGSGVLGTPTSDYLTIVGNGGGLGRAYTGGSIYWNASAGANYVVPGAIRDYYFARNGASGSLGFPTSAPAAFASNGGGTGQVFQAGSVYASSRGAFRVGGAVRDKYWSMGGADGVLGWPTSEQSSSEQAGGGIGQGFQNGAVYVSRAGSWPVLGDFEKYYAARGNAGGGLGWPASGPIPIESNGGGTGQAFTASSVYQRAGGAPVAVSGLIRTVYFLNKGADGPFGWPTGEQRCSSETCVQTFQFAEITTGPAGWSWRSPDIDAAWSIAGGQSKLGSAISGYLILSVGGGGIARAYENGSVYSSARGAFAVSGGIRDRYFAENGAAGSLGWPTGPETCGLANGGCRQSFAGGEIYWVAGDRGRITTEALFNAWSTLGGPSGVLGTSRSDVVKIGANGGGTGQAFTNGSIFDSERREPLAVSGAIRDTYFARGGAAGHLGWPATQASCSTSGLCSQGFDYGTIDWSASTGAVVR